MLNKRKNQHNVVLQNMENGKIVLGVKFGGGSGI